MASTGFDSCSRSYGPEVLHPALGLNGRRGRGGGAGHDTPGPISTCQTPSRPDLFDAYEDSEWAAPVVTACVMPVPMGRHRRLCSLGEVTFPRGVGFGSARYYQLPIPYGWMAPAFNTPMDPIWARGAASPAGVETFFTCYVLRVTC